MERENCIFCGIAGKRLAANLIYEDGELVAFKDISPKAPVHFLIVPRKHIDDHLALDETDCGWLGRAHLVANQLAKELGIEDGFRVVLNCREKAGQTVGHLHMHVMGGRNFTWPPG